MRKCLLVKKFILFFFPSWFHFLPCDPSQRRARTSPNSNHPSLFPVLQETPASPRRAKQKKRVKNRGVSAGKSGSGRDERRIGQRGVVFWCIFGYFFFLSASGPGFSSHNDIKKENPEKPEVRPEFRVTAPKKWEFVRIPCSHAPPRSVWEGGSGVPSLPWGCVWPNFVGKQPERGWNSFLGNDPLHPLFEQKKEMSVCAKMWKDVTFPSL